jgi:hypothetical protein
VACSKNLAFLYGDIIIYTLFNKTIFRTTRRCPDILNGGSSCKKKLDREIRNLLISGSANGLIDFRMSPSAERPRAVLGFLPGLIG